MRTASAHHDPNRRSGRASVDELDSVRVAELALREVLALRAPVAPLDDADLLVLTGLAVLVPEAAAEVVAAVEVAQSGLSRRSAVALHSARYAATGDASDLLGASMMLCASTAAERRCTALALGLLASRHDGDDETWASIVATAMRSGGAEGEWVAAAVVASSMSSGAARDAVAAIWGRMSSRARVAGPLSALLRGEPVPNEFFGPFMFRLTAAMFARMATRTSFAGRRAWLLSVDTEPTEHERRSSARELLARPSLRVRAEAVRARLDHHPLAGWNLRPPVVAPSFA